MLDAETTRRELLDTFPQLTWANRGFAALP